MHTAQSAMEKGAYGDEGRQSLVIVSAAQEVLGQMNMQDAAPVLRDHFGRFCNLLLLLKSRIQQTTRKDLAALLEDSMQQMLRGMSRRAIDVAMENISVLNEKITDMFETKRIVVGFGQKAHKAFMRSVTDINVLGLKTALKPNEEGLLKSVQARISRLMKAESRWLPELKDEDPQATKKKRQGGSVPAVQTPNLASRQQETPPAEA